MSLAVSLYGGFGMLARPGLRQMLHRRVARGKEIPARLTERFGVSALPRPAGRLIWIHAASVGEMNAVLPVIAALGDCEVLLTTGTLTSAELAAERLPANARHQFVPLDVPVWVENFLAHWRPDGAVFVESEIWPVMLTALDSHGIPRLLINARMSARSASRWARLPQMARLLLGAFRYIHVQSAQDAEHLSRLGLSDLLEWGNLKFASPLLPGDEAMLAAMRGQINGPVWLAASTHPGEEAMVLAAHKLLLRQFPGLVTMIVPRHAARGAEIAAMAWAPRRSLGQMPEAGKIYVADTMGELGLFYRLAPFAFIGGSLVRHGGQNVIEPARLGLPLLCGPHTANFTEAVASLKDCGALLEVADTAGLAAQAAAWLQNPAAAQTAGQAAARAFAADETLPGRLARLILETAL
jgi:3-deoxy-D-manno-octulosonic-acid transferase